MMNCSINRTRNVHKDYKIWFYCKKLSADLIEFTLETSLDFIRWTCASQTGRGSSLISHFWNILWLWSRDGACAWSRSVRRRVLGVHAPLSEIMSSERALDTTVMMCHTVCRYNDIITVMFGSRNYHYLSLADRVTPNKSRVGLHHSCFMQSGH